jgi:TonB family protein
VISWFLRSEVKKSASIHLFMILFFFVILKFDFQIKPATEKMIVEIFEPIEAQKIQEITETQKIVLKSVNEQTKDQQQKVVREVFGANRNSYTDSNNSATAISVKLGNTVTKEVDNKLLNENDVDSLPTPTEEYLVSQMPQVIREVKPKYPEEARLKKIEGDVVLDILIDQNGKVRQANIIEGDPIFRLTALEAIKSFLFKPAQVSGKNVAVKIRYILKFKLEY